MKFQTRHDSVCSSYNKWPANGIPESALKYFATFLLVFLIVILLLQAFLWQFVSCFTLKFLCRCPALKVVHTYHL